ncbi:hypothetical protein [Legionella jordanis]|uniref:Uncharacterized protein n=1 Tax=Legionella jordanis TaxID=456 RepID=A0A0W0VC50_9GAMM|nr:hypothetical protein [Legionella jordanis]KTD17209.1 hypothetical protein Ljor_1515 [Legionella jordanis]RMX03329.1 hypothetical protein EAW55_07885 [Legionella jordanis]RMX15808.1 hypothetical protein EAS68_11240 [Legionella jordanis]VEH12593.1 Uncharacterised protein [Legionella jordanis]HAT8713333.1 hypothetical protein [Legionella jordanis]
MLEHGERIANPPRYYCQPSSILADGELTVEEQIIALKNWRDDINLRLIAAEENMGSGTSDVTLVSEIDNLLCFLESTETDKI